LQQHIESESRVLPITQSIAQSRATAVIFIASLILHFLKKCKEMQLDFRQNRTVIPPLTFNDNNVGKGFRVQTIGLMD
jgi:hypothetical protein